MSGVLQTELQNLIAQGRKRNNDLKNSAETSLALLTDLGDAPNLAHLSTKKEFVSPFLMACTSSNSKSCVSSLQCLQIIVSSHALAPDRIEDTLRALLEAAQLGIAMQLKVLQLIPIILETYHADIKGTLLAKLLSICTEVNKDQKQMVSNTAYATLQQLITSLYDRIEKTPGSNQLEVEGQAFQVNMGVYDAARVLLDLCEIAENQSPRFLQIKNLPTAFTLELLELTLTNHYLVFHDQPVFRVILSSRIVPLLLRLFSEFAHEFALLIRVTRIFYLIIRKHLEIITVEAEVILNTLAQTCKKSSDLWIQILCLEVFQGVFSDSTLLEQIFTQYRGNDTSSALGDIVACFASALVKSELPLAFELAPPISKQDNPKVPSIDMLDKTEPPSFHTSYFFYLIMVCLNSIVDGVAKLSSSLKKQNTGSPAQDEKIVGILREVQAPFTNLFTMLLGGSMDLDLFKLLVKSVQRVAHICGVNNLDQLRDEYITILVQYSYFPNGSSIPNTLLQRYIFCIRALFNLGFALGNKLGPSWSLIVDCIASLEAQIQPNTLTTAPEFFEEERYQPISQSLRRMLEQTVDLEDDSILQIVSTFFSKPQFIHLACVGYLVKANAERYYNQKLWTSFSDTALGIIKNESVGADKRLATARMLDTAIINVMGYARDGDTLRTLIKSLYDQVQCDQTQSSSSSSAEIQLGALTTMNTILDQFFARFSTGWEEIFEIISFVAESNSSRPDLFRNSFKALELICHDFLENLPYACIFELTLCLDKFSRQDQDLNTSFTATSLFWSVCDYLIKTLPKTEIGEFNVDNEDSLIAVARDKDSPLKQYALWMLAEIKLAHIASEPQHQIKTGAARIFFRLVDAHYKSLPDPVWQKCLELVFPEITKVKVDEDPSDADETNAIIINGLGTIYSANISRSVGGLIPIFSYFSESSRLSVSNVLYTLKQVSSIMDAASDLKVDNNELNAVIWSYWINQNPAPEYNHRQYKTIYDSLEYIVDLFGRIDQFMALDTAHVCDAVKLLTRCAMYNQSTVKLFPLQEKTLNQLEYIWEHHDNPETKAIILDSVGDLATYCYSGVPQNNFAALSTQSQELLLKLLQVSTVNDTSVLKNAVALMENSGDRKQAIEIFQSVLRRTKNRSAIEKDAIRGGLSILGGGINGDTQTDAISEFFKTIEGDDSIGSESWQKLLTSLTANSLLYQRGYYFTKKYMEAESEAPPHIDGTIETETATKRQSVSYLCLELLMYLSLRERPYSESAKWQFYKRTEMVLLQYIGDLKIRGMEPISTLLQDELLFILALYKANPGMVSPPVKVLLLKCITSPDPQVLSTIQEILI